MCRVRGVEVGEKGRGERERRACEVEALERMR